MKNNSIRVIYDALKANIPHEISEDLYLLCHCLTHARRQFYELPNASYIQTTLYSAAQNEVNRLSSLFSFGIGAITVETKRSLMDDFSEASSLKQLFLK